MVEKFYIVIVFAVLVFVILGVYSLDSVGAFSGGRGFDFSLSLSPTGGNVSAGSNTFSTVTVTYVKGKNQLVSLSASGQPSGVTITFSPSSVFPTATSTMSIGISSTVTPGTYTITVKGVGGGVTKRATYTLTVTQQQPFDFSLSLSPTSGTVQQGKNVTTIITANLVSGSTKTVSFSASGLPSGTSIYFAPSSCSPSCNSFVGFVTSSTTPLGNYSIIISGTDGTITRTATYILSVIPPPPFDYSISVNPSGILVARGSSNTSTISVTLLNGASQPVSLSVTGCEVAGAICSASPNNGNPTFQSTLNVITFFNSTTGTFPITITGTGGGVTRTASASVTIV